MNKTVQDMLYDYAIKFVGLPYIWGGDDPIRGFDCSGLVVELLKAFGLVEGSYDGSAEQIYQKYLPQVASVPEFGTLVFFGHSTDTITHVGFCLNNYLMLEAGGGDSSCTDSDISAKKNAFIRIRPITRRSDAVAFVKPNWG
jgi:cell wall-associated NlpC family hydrolase